MFESGFAQSICQLTFILQNINSYQLKNRLFNQRNLQNLKFRTFLLQNKSEPLMLSCILCISKKEMFQKDNVLDILHELTYFNPHSFMK